MLLEGLHHDPDKVQHMQEFAASLLAQDAVLLLQLKSAEGTAKHCTDLDTHINADMLLLQTNQDLPSLQQRTFMETTSWSTSKPSGKKQALKCSKSLMSVISSELNCCKCKL